MSSIDWERVQEGLVRDRHRIIWRPYGLPDVLDLERSRFFDGPVQPDWPIPDRMIVSVAITGAFFQKSSNPSQPITTEEILADARASAQAGATTVHIHVRDERGYNTLSVDRFREVIDPLRSEFPELPIDGCLVPVLEDGWAEMTRALEERVFDATPINTTTVYLGDTLFSKPLPLILEKTRLALEAGVKPILSCYTDGDVSIAARYLIRSGLVETPAYWLILPSLPGCSPMENPRQMIDGLMRTSSAIFDVDSEATIMVCAAGRASMHLVAVAAALGLHIRVGMEDTIWLWPHRDELIASNLQAFEMAKQLAEALGREIATPAEYRQMVGMQQREAVAAKAPS